MKNSFKNIKPYLGFTFHFHLKHRVAVGACISMRCSSAQVLNDARRV